jgi:hypothetical protein
MSKHIVKLSAKYRAARVIWARWTSDQGRSCAASFSTLSDIAVGDLPHVCEFTAFM